MCPRLPVLLLLLSVVPAPLLAAEKKVAPALKPAGDYVANETHAAEHVTVAADPCDDPKKCDWFRLEYIQHGFLPIRVVFTNNGEQPLNLDDVRIQFISGNKDVIPAANLEDINRRLFSRRSAQGTRVPGLPIPITIHHEPIDKKVTQDDTDFGFPGTIVAPHATLGGYLFYDIRNLDDPAMKGAEIYIKEAKTAGGKELFAFTIPLDKWLAAQPGSNKVAPAKRADDPDDHAWHPDDTAKPK